MDAPLKNNGNKAFARALLISLLGIHVPLAVFLTTVEMDLARKIDAQPQKNAPVFVTLKQEQMPPRIVDIAKPKNQKVPKKPTALSQYNSSVAEETTAKPSKPKATPASKPTKAGSTTPIESPKTTEKPQKTKQPVAKQDKPTEQAPPPEETFTSSRTLPMKPLETPPAGDIKDQLQNLRHELQTKEKESYQKTFGGNSGFTMPDIKPSVGGTGEDFQPSYKVGNRTFVNTLATPGVGYFVELKRRFRTAFNPIPILRPLYERIAGRGKVSVILGVSVDARGRLAEVVMIKSSGIPAYDQEARRTISQSAPFSAPASNLLDNTGRLNMAWTFTVYL